MMGKASFRRVATMVRKNWYNISLYIIFGIIICGLFLKKTDFHVDELLTYNLANAESWLNPENDIMNVPASQPFIDGMASNGTFDLRHVWTQQAMDTHPPLYYVLVHAICTIFPNTFSIRYAALINIVFQILILYIYRKILGLLIENKKVIYVMSLMYVLCTGVLSITTFLRMYVMTMFWVVLFAYIILKDISEFRKSDYVTLSLIFFGGGLTHYYFIVYAFLLSVILVIVLALEKRIKEIFSFTMAMVGAGGFSCLFFPAMLKHIFSGKRGTQSINNLRSADLFEQFKIYYDIINNNLFGGLLGVLLLVIFLVLLLNFIYADQDKEMICQFDKVEIQRYVCIVVPVFLYVLLISKTAPYNTDRYASPVYALVIVGVMCLFYKCISCLLNKEKNIVGLYSIIVIIIVTMNFHDFNWEYLYESNKERLSNAEEYGANANAICLYGAEWQINPYFLEISKCKSSTFYNITDYDQFIEYFSIDRFGDNIAFFLIGIDADVFLERFLEDYPGYELIKDNGNYGYGKSVYLENGNE